MNTLNDDASESDDDTTNADGDSPTPASIAAAPDSSEQPVETDTTDPTNHPEATVAAVDVSGSTDGTSYSEAVNRVLRTLTVPLTVIQWDDTARLTRYETMPKEFLFYAGGGTRPDRFMILLKDFDKPIHLHIFTDGDISEYEVKACREILDDSKNLVIRSVHLHYIGDEKDMNLNFTKVFDGLPITIRINEEHAASLDPEFDFDHVDYQYIMRDHSFKAEIARLLNAEGTDQGKLNKRVCDKSAHILKSYFKGKLSIRDYCESRDVEACVRYVRKHAHFDAKSDFQRKMSDILRLFEPGVDAYAMSTFRAAPEEEAELTYEEPDLECDSLQCDVLYEGCKTG